MEIKNDISYCVRQTVPFAADLPQDLNVGKAICVSGVVLPKCSRFVPQNKFIFVEFEIILMLPHTRVRNLDDVNKQTICFRR
jgi:hypothetical protein